MIQELNFNVSDHEFNPFVDPLNSASMATSLSQQAVKVIKDPVTKSINCDVCNKSFASIRTYTDHKKQVHDKSNHIKCDECHWSTFEPYR